MKNGCKKLKWFLILLFIMTGVVIGGDDVKAESYMITEDTVWDGNYTIDGAEGLIITAGATLTVEAGTIITMNAGSNVLVAGNLILNGSVNEPIVFTSGSNDDSSDWGAIMINHPSSTVQMNYVQIKYGGNPMGVLVVNQADTVVLSNCEIINNSAGIITNSANLQISYSNIYNPDSEQLINGRIYLGTTILNNSGATLNLINNYWGSEEGPTINPPEMRGTWISGLANYKPFFTEPIVFTEPVFGCTDSEANNYNAEATIDDGSCSYHPDPVILVPGILGSWNVGLGWELDPILHTYDNLWSALKNAGYREGVDLFALPYNWRLANTYSALELKNKIDEVKAICGCNQVDIVAHSMGGLVARAYIQLLNYDNDIDQLIFLATPQRGAPKAYLMWEGGEFGVKIQDKIQQRIFELEAKLNGYADVFDYLNNMPIESVKELLPIDSYLKDAGGDIKLYPNDYPENIFLDILNGELAMNRLAGVNIVNMVANAGAESTLNYIRVTDNGFDDGRWPDGYSDGFDNIFGDHGLEYGQGDGTVPEYSNGNFAGADDIIFDSSHNRLVTDSQSEVIEELTGNRPAEETKENIFDKFLMIRIFSPADINVSDPNNHKIGKDFNNNSVVNEVDGRFYSGFNIEPEFILIPNPVNGEYHINLQGVNNGEYRVSVSYLDDNTAIDRDYIGNIESGKEIGFTVNLTGNVLSELKIIVEEPVENIANDGLSFEIFTKHIANDAFHNIQPVKDTELLSNINLLESAKHIGGAPTNRLIKLVDCPAVYYVDEYNIRHLFPTADIFGSWFNDYSLVETISQVEFDEMVVGSLVAIKPQVKKIKFDNSNKIYAVLVSGDLEQTDNVGQEIIIPVAFEYFYRAGGRGYLIAS